MPAALRRLSFFGRYSFMYDLNDVGRILNLLYQQQLFTVADVEYELRAKVILRMREEDKAQAEAWLTEHLNRPIELEQETQEFVEVPVG